MRGGLQRTDADAVVLLIQSLPGQWTLEWLTEEKPMTKPVLATMFIPPDHDWTFRVGDWQFGFRDYASPTPVKTMVYLGPTGFLLRGASAIQVGGVTGIALAVLIALAVFLVTHRRGRTSP